MMRKVDTHSLLGFLILSHETFYRQACEGALDVKLHISFAATGKRLPIATNKE
jgi:hypothetical protein